MIVFFVCAYVLDYHHNFFVMSTLMFIFLSLNNLLVGSVRNGFFFSLSYKKCLLKGSVLQLILN
jgi:dolichyl-phosphate-mannose--protein O-mannosyl transferase